jgi:hypothetical protein
MRGGVKCAGYNWNPEDVEDNIFLSVFVALKIIHTATKRDKLLIWGEAAAAQKED